MNESFFRNPFDIEFIAGDRKEDLAPSNASSLACGDENKESSTANSGSANLRKDN